MEYQQTLCGSSRLLDAQFVRGRIGKKKGVQVAMHAEITTKDILGAALEEQAARRDIQSIVEIGTWSGMGSTLCILEGIIRSGNFEKNFLTFEVNADRHTEAVENLKGYSAKMPNFRLVYGSVITPQEMPAYIPKGMNKEWYDGDLRNMSTAPCHFDLIPPRIDLLFIDGGEYSGEMEFRKLRERSRVIILDDTKTMKCRKARRHLSYNRHYRRLFDALDFRNGCCGFERMEKRRHAFSSIPVCFLELVRFLKLVLSPVIRPLRLVRS